MRKRLTQKTALTNRFQTHMTTLMQRALAMRGRSRQLMHRAVASERDIRQTAKFGRYQIYSKVAQALVSAAFCAR
jgi:hypothetical protein